MPADDTGHGLPDEVYAAAMARLADIRYDPHPDNQHARHGLSNYALAEVLHVAYTAGRASVLDGAREVWSVRWPDGFVADPHKLADGDRDVARACLTGSTARKDLTLVHRYVTPWVPAGGQTGGAG